MRGGRVETDEDHLLFVCLQVIFALNQTLLQHESLRAGSLQVPYTTEDLIRHYNCGDLNSIIFNHDTSQVRLCDRRLLLRTVSYRLISSDHLIHFNFISSHLTSCCHNIPPLNPSCLFIVPSHFISSLLD